MANINIDQVKNLYIGLCQENGVLFGIQHSENKYMAYFHDVYSKK